MIISRAACSSAADPFAARQFESGLCKLRTLLEHCTVVIMSSIVETRFSKIARWKARTTPSGDRKALSGNTVPLQSMWAREI
jgi:hypothetical protein